jgi:AbrB family looped-hinge helix DNA binding protein
MNYITNITSKGQITVNKAVREGLGLKPGDPVEIEFDGSGKAAFRKADEGARIKAHKADMMKRIERVQKAFREQDCFPMDMTNQEWFEMMRGPRAEV